MYETEHRLRSFLNGNQAQREKLCAALLPTLGRYSAVMPRRPEGGPDGGRDIEALFNGVLVTWGAIGFRNDAGSSANDRSWAQRKFTADLDAALRQNPSLQGFVFLTNVDLTPEQHNSMKREAFSRKLGHVEVFDFHRLRNALDQPTGLLARLQYLDIEMSKEEQLALVHGFGQELQKTINSGFSRIDKTLERMEKFLDVRKPLHNVTMLYSLDQRLTEITSSPQIIVAFIQGLWPGSRNCLMMLARVQQKESSDAVVAELESWLVTVDHNNKATSTPERHLTFPATKTPGGVFVTAGYGFSFSAGGGSLHLADVVEIQASIFASPVIAPHLTRFQLDMNGYIVVSRDRMYEEGSGSKPTPLYIPNALAQEALNHVLSCACPISHDGLRRSSLSFSKSQ